jgi:hypothetical protein
MGHLKKLFGGESALPVWWDDVPSFNLIIPIASVEVDAIEHSILQAEKVRAKLLELCKDKYFYDELFQTIGRKRTHGEPLAPEEERYLNQADSNYLQLAYEKMEIVLYFEGDFWGITAEQRGSLYRLAENHPGSSLVSGLSGVRYGKTRLLAPGTSLTDDQAAKLLMSIIT